MCRKAAGGNQKRLFYVFLSLSFVPVNVSLCTQSALTAWPNVSQSQSVFSCCVSPSSPASVGFGLGCVYIVNGGRLNAYSLHFGRKRLSAVCKAGQTGRNRRERNGRRRVAGAAQACRTRSANTSLFTPGVQCLTGHEIAFPLSEERSSPPRFTWRNRANAESNCRFN